MVITLLSMLIAIVVSGVNISIGQVNFWSQSVHVNLTLAGPHLTSHDMTYVRWRVTSRYVTSPHVTLP